MGGVHSVELDGVSPVHAVVKAPLPSLTASHLDYGGSGYRIIGSLKGFPEPFAFAGVVPYVVLAPFVP